MKKLIFLVSFLCLAATLNAQNGNKVQQASELGYEQKIAEKACVCISEKEDIENARQTVIDCTIAATNQIHEGDSEGKYKRDFTVEGIRKLHYDVFQILKKDCDAIEMNK